MVRQAERERLRQEEIAQREAYEKAQKEKMSLREQEKQRAAEEKKRLEEQLERAENERRKAAEIARAKELEEENRKYEEEKRRKREAEKQRQLEYEQQRKADMEERKQAEAAKEAAKRKAEEERRKEEEAAEESRKVREQQRKAALEELQEVREDIAKELAAVAADDKENIPKNGGGSLLPADLIEKKSVEEQKRRASYGVVKNVLEQDSIHRKEAESVVAASRKAAEEVADVKTRIEANLERSGRGEQEGPVYYGINSTARRSSQDCGGAKKDINVINDDLADEIEAIRLAADFSSRRMLNDQKKEPTTGSASSSRLRIRALLDKQTKQREEDDKVRQQKRESQDMSKFMWVYR